MITVRFCGASAREGPLTLGQADMLAWIVDATEPASVFAVWDVPGGTSAGEIEGIIRQLLTRHESLRTTYRLGPPPVQVVAGSGELTMAECPSPDGTLEFAERLAVSLAVKPFDLVNEWPLRVTVVTAAGVPVHLVVVVSHAAADMASLGLLSGEWAALSAGQPVPPPATVQPIDLAAQERSPAGRRRTAAAAAHWQAQLRAGPHATFAVPGMRGGCSMQPLLLVRSRPAAAAVSETAARTRASRSSVVLAAACAMVSHYTAQHACLVTSVSANRFRSELARFVGPLSRDALLAVNADVPTFDDLVRQVHQQAMFAYARACDDTTLAPMIDGFGRDAGTWYARDFEFNDHSNFHTVACGTRAVPDPGSRLQLTWLPGRVLASRLTVWVNRLDDLLEIALWAEPSLLPTGTAEYFGAGLVALIGEAAGRPVPLAELTPLTGLRPVDRSSEWVRVGPSWVSLGAVRRLVADALPAQSARVYAVPDDRHGHRLVCHVAGDLTPRVLHDACMAALPGRTAAIAPHWYVAGAGTEARTEGDGRRPGARNGE